MAICNEISLLGVGLVMGAIGILASGASRDLLDSFLQMITPINEKALTGWYLVFYRTLYLTLLVALLIVITVLLI
jgi:hypothetical protein